MTEKLSYSIPSAAAQLDVSESTVWRLVRDGELQTAKIRGATVIRRGRLLAYLRKAEQASAA
jgi:excisionase family DNA binding protein